MLKYYPFENNRKLGVKSTDVSVEINSYRLISDNNMELGDKN